MLLEAFGIFFIDIIDVFKPPIFQKIQNIKRKRHTVYRIRLYKFSAFFSKKPVLGFMRLTVFIVKQIKIFFFERKMLITIIPHFFQYLPKIFFLIRRLHGIIETINDRKYLLMLFIQLLNSDAMLRLPC